MTEIVEQRVKSTVIRRRAKKEEMPPAPEPESALSSQKEVAEAIVEKIVQPVPAKEPLKEGPVQKEEPVSAKTGQTVPKTPGPTKEKDSLVYKSAVKLSDPSVAGSIGRGLRIIKQAEPVSESAKKPAGFVPVKSAAAALKEAEEKIKRGPKKKLSKAEMNYEDIKRAGGLKHYVASDEVQPVGETQDVEKDKDRVFEPGPRRKKTVKRQFLKTQITVPGAKKKVLKIAEVITVSELSQNLGVKAGELLKKLMELGMMATINQAVDVDTATLIAKEYGFEVAHVAFKEEQVFEVAKRNKGENILSRPPVVTVMGHVDHGKTSILDFIRKTKVAAGEAGGITQHVGAYEVTTPKGKITFIDTPGHAAFTAMRARGAKVTDIVILVVAADDGVMPQTKEAIDHAKAAGVPMVVAINKIDKPEANIERARRALSEYGVLPEEWGGDTICVGTSAKSGEGIDKLLEMVLLQAEVMELKANVSAAAKGTIIEAKLDRGLGPVATVLVQEGTLKVGSSVVCGLYFGKIRTLVNTKGETVLSAGPSGAVSIIGLSGVPLAGDELLEAEDEKSAREVSSRRQNKQRQMELAKGSTRVSLEDFHKQVEAGEVKELNIILKADVHGSIEAIKEALSKLSTEKVSVKVLHAGVGGVNESDVLLASASNAIIIGFNVVPETGVSSVAEQEGIEIKRYSIIYELIDEVKKSMEGLLSPISKEKITGHAKVRQVFTISKVGTIAGCGVSDGKIVRNAGIRLVRDNIVIWTGKLGSLKRFKDDAKEVNEGNECGIGLEGYNDIKVDDVIESFIIEQIAQKL